MFVQQTSGEALCSDPDVTQAGSVHTSMMCTVSTFGSIDVRSKNARASLEADGLVHQISEDV